MLFLWEEWILFYFWLSSREVVGGSLTEKERVTLLFPCVPVAPYQQQNVVYCKLTCVKTFTFCLCKSVCCIILQDYKKEGERKQGDERWWKLKKKNWGEKGLLKWKDICAIFITVFSYELFVTIDDDGIFLVICVNTFTKKWLLAFVISFFLILHHFFHFSFSSSLKIFSNIYFNTRKPTR